MMTYLIGKRGLLLMEVLTAVAILSVGILITFRPLLTGLNAVGHLDNRMEALSILDRELWEIRKQMREDFNFELKDREFVVSEKTKIFNFKLTKESVANYEKLFKIRMTITWPEGSIKKNITRETLLLGR